MWRQELISIWTLWHIATTLPLELQTNISVQLYFLLRVASVIWRWPRDPCHIIIDTSCGTICCELVYIKKKTLLTLGVCFLAANLKLFCASAIWTSSYIGQASHPSPLHFPDYSLLCGLITQSSITIIQFSKQDTEAYSSKVFTPPNL